MSMCYWAIYGYGIEATEMISEDKINALYGTEDSEMDLREYQQYRNDHISSDFYLTDDGQDEFYFLYTPSSIFNMSETEKAFTCEDDIAAKMYEELKPILYDNIDFEAFKKQMDWVSTYGAG